MGIVKLWGLLGLTVAVIAVAGCGVSAPQIGASATATAAPSPTPTLMLSPTAAVPVCTIAFNNASAALGVGGTRALAWCNAYIQQSPTTYLATSQPALATSCVYTLRGGPTVTVYGAGIVTNTVGVTGGMDECTWLRLYSTLDPPVHGQSGNCFVTDENVDEWISVTGPRAVSLCSLIAGTAGTLHAGTAPGTLLQGTPIMCTLQYGDINEWVSVGDDFGRMYGTDACTELRQGQLPTIGQ